MSDEHDRLLAQGPRVAPEPRMATDEGALVPAVAPDVQAAPAAAPVASASSDSPVRAQGARRSTGTGSGIRPTVFRRLIPVLFALFIVARSIGGGRVQAALFGVLAVVVVTVILVHKARQL